MSEILTLNNITQFFFQGSNKVEVLKNLDLNIPRATKIAIIGSSGSGKSSLLNIASLLQTPKVGNIFIMGKNASKLNDNHKSHLRRKNIGYIYQQNSLLMEFTAFENIYLALLLNKFNAGYAKEKAMELLKLVKLEERAKHKPSSLSGGEQQRVAIARAISNSPEIIIADEPTGNLDKTNSNNIINELLKISAINKTSLLLATHDLSIAKKMDKIYKLQDGVLFDYEE
jgi:lipoprotein-releasing system ATP-binding protein